MRLSKTYLKLKNIEGYLESVFNKYGTFMAEDA